MKFEAPNQILIKTIFGEVGKNHFKSTIYRFRQVKLVHEGKNKAWLAKTQQKKREKLCEIRR
jgi:hypothetical protein